MIVGAIWGGGSGLIFGALPTAAIVYVLLDNLWWSRTPDEVRAFFALFWGAILLLSILLGAMAGFFLGRVKH